MEAEIKPYLRFTKRFYNAIRFTLRARRGLVFCCNRDEDGFETWRLAVTTTSSGFPPHSYPYDFWRFTVGDFKAIFSGMAILKLIEILKP